ncbi:MAG: hypothetical protein AB9866_01835 [Syntrophobacteraceae bacterium]
MRNRSLLLMLSILLLSRPVFAGDVESFNSRLFDLQYFTRPFERAAAAGGAWEGAEGSAASTVQNPAALASVSKPELLTYWTLNYLKGETYGLKRVIPPGPGNPQPVRICEKPEALLSSVGAYQTFRPGLIPGTLGFGADYLWSGFTDNRVSQIEQSGYRLGLSWGVPLGERISVGYGLTYLDDTWHWDVTWAQFSPGSPVPSNVNYLLRSSGSSWRHRFGLHGDVGGSFRYGLEGDLGHGHTDNTWNGVDTGGDNGMRYYAFRAGFEFNVTPKTIIAVENEWHSIVINFGRHPGSIGGSGAVAAWDTSVLRPMAGVKHSVTESFQLLAGYRYSTFNTVDMCHKSADSDYSTFSIGTVFALLNKRLVIRWNIEYSTVSPEGEFMNLLALQADF